MQKILIISDHNELKEKLTDFLDADLYRLEHSPTPQQGLDKWQTFRPDLVILDINLNSLNGKELCTFMKEKDKQSKILFINFAENTVKALRDNLRKQDDELEALISKINNLLASSSAYRYYFDGNSVDYRSYLAVNKAKQEFYLHEREINIFRLFSQKPQQLIKREEILEKVWQGEVYPSSLTIEKHIRKLKRVFEISPEKQHYFYKIPGIGYKFNPKGNQE